MDQYAVKDLVWVDWGNKYGWWPGEVILNDGGRVVVDCNPDGFSSNPQNIIETKTADALQSLRDGWSVAMEDFKKRALTAPHSLAADSLVTEDWKTALRRRVAESAGLSPDALPPPPRIFEREQKYLYRVLTNDDQPAATAQAAAPPATATPRTVPTTAPAAVAAAASAAEPAVALPAEAAASEGAMQAVAAAAPAAAVDESENENCSNKAVVAGGRGSGKAVAGGGAAGAPAAAAAEQEAATRAAAVDGMSELMLLWLLADYSNPPEGQ